MCIAKGGQPNSKVLSHNRLTLQETSSGNIAFMGGARGVGWAGCALALALPPVAPQKKFRW